MKNYIKFICFAILFLFSCSKNKLLENNLYIEKVINSFLNKSNKVLVSRDYIENQVYDIYDKSMTRGRAIHIGDNLFLTANHVVSHTEDGRLIRQAIRNNVDENQNGTYTVLDFDATTDIALLKVNTTDVTGVATFRLIEDNLKKGDTVSQFVYYSKYKKAPPKNKRYVLQYDGLNYYDNIMPQANLGRFVFLPGSLLFEKQGSIWNFNASYFKALDISTEEVSIEKENQYFTSIPVFPGESGSGIFLRTGQFEDAKYSLCCITIIAWATSHLVQTKGHPLGYKTMQQSSDFVIRNDIIRKFLFNFLSVWKKNKLKFNKIKKKKIKPM